MRHALCLGGIHTRHRGGGLPSLPAVQYTWSLCVPKCISKCPHPSLPTYWFIQRHTVNDLLACSNQKVCYTKAWALPVACWILAPKIFIKRREPLWHAKDNAQYRRKTEKQVVDLFLKEFEIERKRRLLGSKDNMVSAVLRSLRWPFKA